jgi:hypothetical protein
MSASSASALQREQMAKIMKNPQLIIPVEPKTLPTQLEKKPKFQHTPETLAQIAGSSAAAGSGEFHLYKRQKRKELDRLKEETERDEEELAAADFQQKRAEAQLRDDAKTEKNRKRRRKRRAKSTEDNTATANPTVTLDQDSEQDEAGSEQVAPEVTANRTSTRTSTTTLIIVEDDL